MSRPLANDPTLIRQAVAHLTDAFGIDAGDDRAIDELVGVVLDNPNEDEYRKTRALEYKGWDCTRSTVDAFEQLESEIHDRHRLAVRDWVAKCHITPRLSVGDPVEVKKRRQAHAGIIAAIRAEDGHYVVRIPSEGHVAVGQCGIQGWQVPFEELHDICNDPTDFSLAHPPGTA